MPHYLDIEALEEFLSIDSPKNSTLTLGGTGLNGAIQVPFLSYLGYEKFLELNRINIVSGSSFSLFLFLANQNEKILRNHFLQFDAVNRRIHNASFLRALKHFSSQKTRKLQLYPNDFLDRTMSHLISADFLELTLADLPSNIVFWSFCHTRKQLVQISSGSEFNDLKVSEIVRYCASVPLLHGYFEYKDYKFSDPIYSPKARELFSKLSSTTGNHLYSNMMKKGRKKNTIFSKPHRAKNTNVLLISDFFRFSFNIPNPSISKTHLIALGE